MAEIKRIKHMEIISIEEEYHVGVVRRIAAEHARLIGFEEIRTTLIITSVSELARNILVHAGKGTVTFRGISTGEKRGLEIIFADRGPGLEDTARVFSDGYSTKGSLGIGLSGAKRMMDELEIESRPGEGTTIWARKWL
ncbi:MAG: ATP-binding protein [Peptococcaceae bacterium]|nr:MAG: ATP-binding protein [Peptococcaceae bacterium]